MDSSPWDSPGQNTAVGSLSILHGVFPTQGLNLGLPHCRQILYHLSHKGSPRILEWVAYPFSSRSSQLRNRNRVSQPRNQTGVSCIAERFFTNGAIKNPYFPLLILISLGSSLHTCDSQKPHDFFRVQANFLIFGAPVKGLTYLYPQYVFLRHKCMNECSKESWTLFTSSWQNQIWFLPKRSLLLSRGILNLLLLVTTSGRWIRTFRLFP